MFENRYVLCDLLFMKAQKTHCGVYVIPPSIILKCLINEIFARKNLQSSHSNQSQLTFLQIAWSQLFTSNRNVIELSWQSRHLPISQFFKIWIS